MLECRTFLEFNEVKVPPSIEFQWVMNEYGGVRKIFSPLPRHTPACGRSRWNCSDGSSCSWSVYWCGFPVGSSSSCLRGLRAAGSGRGSWRSVRIGLRKVAGVARRTHRNQRSKSVNKTSWEFCSRRWWLWCCRKQAPGCQTGRTTSRSTGKWKAKRTEWSFSPWKGCTETELWSDDRWRCISLW